MGQHHRNLQKITFGKHSSFIFSESYVTEYNKVLREYFKDYEEYANELFIAFDFSIHSIKIEFLLENTGTAPAQDIDIEIYFPDGFELFTEDDLPNLNKKPVPPNKPKNKHDSNFGINSIAGSIINRSKRIDIVPIKLNQPTIKRTNSYIVTYHLNS